MYVYGKWLRVESSVGPLVSFGYVYQSKNGRNRNGLNHFQCYKNTLLCISLILWEKNFFSSKIVPIVFGWRAIISKEKVIVFKIKLLLVVYYLLGFLIFFWESSYPGLQRKFWGALEDCGPDLCCNVYISLLKQKNNNKVYRCTYSVIEEYCSMPFLVFIRYPRGDSQIGSWVFISGVQETGSVWNVLIWESSACKWCLHPWGRSPKDWV